MENASISASTLSVLRNESDSALCYVEINNFSCNLTLRFDDDKADLRGYPQSWKIWNESLDQYDDESMTFEDIVEQEGLDYVLSAENVDVYISRENEKDFLIQLKVSVKEQFEDEMFKNHLREDQKEEVLKKIDLAISLL